MRVAIGDERQWSASGVRIDERRAREQAHAADTRPKRVAGDREHASRRVALDADAKIRAGQHRGHGSHECSLRWTAREIDEPVVFGERERHRARSLIRARRLLRECGVAARQEQRERQCS